MLVQAPGEHAASRAELDIHMLARIRKVEEGLKSGEPNESRYAAGKMELTSRVIHIHA